MATAGEAIALSATVEDAITAEPGVLRITGVQVAAEWYAAEFLQTAGMHTRAERVRVQAIAHLQRTLQRHTARRPVAEPRAAEPNLTAAVQHTTAATRTSKRER